jgi:hypothetical protein
MNIKIFGYEIDKSNKLLEMKEVTIAGDAHTFLALAKFFQQCATEIQTESHWEHLHLRDGVEPEIVAYNIKSVS